MRSFSADALARFIAVRSPFAALGLLVCCGSDGARNHATPAAPQCTLTAPTTCPEPATTYSDIAPVLAAKCVTCHYGATGGPWPLTSYDDVANWRDAVRDDVLDCSMPPPDSGITLDDAERLAILSWVRCGGVE